MTDLYEGQDGVMVDPANAGSNPPSDKPKKKTTRKAKSNTPKENEAVNEAEEPRVDNNEDEEDITLRPRDFAIADTYGDNTADDFFAEEKIRWNVESSSNPPFEYGYRTSNMTPENLDVNFSELFTKKKLTGDTPQIFMIPGSMRSVYDAIERSPSDLLLGRRQPINYAQMRWMVATNWAIGNYNVENDQYRWLMNDTNAKWRDGYRTQNGKLRGILSPNSTFDRAKLGGASALEVISDSMNLGKPVAVFLPHSGFSVTINQPTLSQLIECERKISSDKIEVGRQTRGLIYSHDLNFLKRAVFELFLACLRDTSLGITDKDFLQNAISVLDLDTIVWAMACAKYPNGWMLAMPCTANPGECNHVHYESVNIRKMWKVDHNKLTDRQQAIATISGRPLQLTETEEYLSGFNTSEYDHCYLDTNNENLRVKVEFLVPTVNAAFTSAADWISNLNNACNVAFSKPLVGDARSKYLMAQKRATNAMVYEHFVNRIVLINTDDNSEVEVVDRTEIRTILLQLTENGYHYDTLLNAINKFINMSTVAIVGIPNVKCEKCGGFHESDDLNQVNRHMIPLDVLSAFSTLCLQLTKSYHQEVEEATIETKA